MLKFINKPKKIITLKDHNSRRNKVLIKRRAGGFGDILVQRMMFEEFHIRFPEVDLFFACPQQYIKVVKDHPFVTPIDINQVKEEEYGIIYDITTACRVHESMLGINNTKNRSDIWANHCGIELSTHEMHLKSNSQEKELLKAKFDHINSNKLPTVLLCTKSTGDMIGEAKSLLNKQIEETTNYLRGMGFYVFTTHDTSQQIYEDLKVYQFCALSYEKWLALVDLADLVVSIDTATFHMAGGLKKPLVGIFSFTDGKIYGKYYDFILVQKHKDDGNWDCGPCFNMLNCPKTDAPIKPCMEQLSCCDIQKGIAKALKKWNLKENDQRIQRIYHLDQKT